MAAGCPMCFQGRVCGFFTFYELVSSRLLSRWSIRFGMWEARNRKGNCGSKQCSACCPSSVPTVSEAFWGENPHGKGGNVSQNAFSDPYPLSIPGSPTPKKGGVYPPRPLTISPAHSPLKQRTHRPEGG
jgi:hypothetical protein